MVIIQLVLSANIAVIFRVDSVGVDSPVLRVLLLVEVPGLKSDPDSLIVSSSTVVSCLTVIASRRLVPNGGVLSLL